MPNLLIYGDSFPLSNTFCAISNFFRLPDEKCGLAGENT